MLFPPPSLVTGRWKPADASEIKALWMIFSQRLFLARGFAMEYNDFIVTLS